MSKLQLPRALETLSLAAALLVVVVIGASAYQTWGAHNLRSEELRLTAEVKIGTTTILSEVKDAETGQRGFLLTDRDRYLEPYRQAIVNLPKALDQLAAAVATRPDQHRRVTLLRPLVQLKLDELRETIDLRRTQGIDAALAVMLTDRGKVVMDQIRELCRELELAADQVTQQQSEGVRRSVQRLGVISTAGSLGIFTLLILSTVTILRGVKRRDGLIHSLQLSESECREARDWLQTTLGSIGDGVIATDAQGKIVFLNAVAQSLTGWTQEHAVGRPMDEIFVITNEDTGATVENPATRALREGRIVGLANHTKLTSRNGTERPIDDSAAPIRDDAGKVSGVVLVFRDVTERKEAELAVEQSIKQFRLMADSAPVMVWIAGADQHRTWLNKTWLEFVGRSLKDELPRDRARNVHPDDREACIAAYEVAFESRRQFSIEYRMQRHDGEYRWLLEHGAPLYDSGGEFNGFIGSCTDITDQKTVEEKLLRANEDLNQFAYAASHDLQEPLRMIASYSQLLVGSYRGHFDEEAAMSVSFITEGTKRMRDLLADLLAYTQVNEAGFHPPESVDLNAVFRSTVADLKAAIEDNNAVVTSEHLPVVRGHAAHFAQLFQNLISNAIKYRGLRPPVIHLSARLQGPEWQFAVADNGLGIDPEYHEKIFGVFKRLHGKDVPGTGIGLAICQRVVERYDGRIWVNSDVGNGSKFYFTLPAKQEGS